MLSTDVATGTAQVLATCALHDDQEAFEAVAQTLPPLVLVACDAIGLLRDATLQALSIELGHQADEIDLRYAAGLVLEPPVRNVLRDWHDFTSEELDRVLPWVAGVLAGGNRLPRTGLPLHLAIVITVIAESFAGFPQEWPAFLAAREAANVC